MFVVYERCLLVALGRLGDSYDKRIPPGKNIGLIV
jgi:hypothetical protein